MKNKQRIPEIVQFPAVALYAVHHVSDQTDADVQIITQTMIYPSAHIVVFSEGRRIKVRVQEDLLSVILYHTSQKVPIELIAQSISQVNLQYRGTASIGEVNITPAIGTRLNVK